MQFLIIMGAISAITLLMTVLMCIDAIHIIRDRYPDLKVPKHSRAARYEAVLKLIIVSLIPIFNIIFLLVIVFKGDEIKESIVENIYKKYSHEEVME